jgi:dihydropyrimidine dehydrogenase (NAD+) subunit PreA
MTDLTTDFLGMQFPNPFLLASAPPTANAHMILDGFAIGWGGAVLKTIGLEPTRNPCPRVHIIKEGRTKVGMVNIELISEWGLAEWLDGISEIRRRFPDRPLIASIMGGGNPHDWQEVVRQLEPRGISAFEMNVSCPNFAAERGAQLGQDPVSLGKAVSWVREATLLPLIVKLTPNVTDITLLARVARESGADAVAATNTLSGLGGIDLQTMQPQPAVEGMGIFGGYSGPGLKPVALRCAAAIARSVDIPIIGGGGISRWQDAAEFISVGCSVVEVCTAVMWNGYGIIKQLTHGLSDYLEQQKLDSLNALIGKALPHLKQYPDLNIGYRLLAKVDLQICNGCTICEKACTSGAYQAIQMKEEKAVIDKAKCDGCGLCEGVCPVDAIRMIPRPV